ncbi:hypothetical protein PFICI_14450 [Pestalotiopsis fici W106-1]|uniref:Uncharacterized protein n=1 Tax=Pestalotiopsis fici (strain W106-1 / CGMCC3.15140) TaxID=1229662 RepID=W3WI95_PESFW|nr:uncharacterized protein PFICI_14450 [Pestalotiopsis fici W106-1]ETS73504.1 hypothetical protein PFICI_14450 [Pestalotiopsis fici W106-1]
MSAVGIVSQQISVESEAASQLSIVISMVSKKFRTQLMIRSMEPAQGTLQLEHMWLNLGRGFHFLPICGTQETVAGRWTLLKNWQPGSNSTRFQKLVHLDDIKCDISIEKFLVFSKATETGDMVLLTMTATIVEVMKQLDDKPVDSHEEDSPSEEPSLAHPAVGKPITHGQIINVWKQSRGEGSLGCSLENLLRGATIYVPPPPPKPEPSDEYKQLMARLRREEEERSYERMIKAPPTRETFAQRFPMAPMTMADSFAEANKPTRQSDLGEENINHGEIQQQITLIINFLVSIAGCAAAFWICAQWWSTTARLFLTLFGTITVAVCEVAVYNAYSWRMIEGDKKQKNTKEVKDIVKTWVIGADEPTKEGYEPVLIQPMVHDTNSDIRQRKVAPF